MLGQQVEHAGSKARGYVQFPAQLADVGDARCAHGEWADINRPARCEREISEVGSAVLNNGVALLAKIVFDSLSHFTCRMQMFVMTSI